MHTLKTVDILGLLVLSVFLSGCQSGHRGRGTEAELPWNRPASWELKRAITTSDSLHREYTAAEVDRRYEKEARLKWLRGKCEGRESCYRSPFYDGSGYPPCNHPTYGADRF